MSIKDWPEHLTLRDTRVYADEGQRIFTTATGYGYEKCDYVRADLAARSAPEAGKAVTDAMVKRATQEFLSHRGERPERIKRGGYALWEENAPAMRAALAAALSTEPGEAEGMVLVPREITAEMAHALESNIAECSAPSDVHRANWADAYRAMLAAAPTSEGSHHGR